MRLIGVVSSTLLWNARWSFLFIVRTSYGQLIESERVEEYHRRGHVWPPSPDEYIPNTPGWRRIMERRFRQIQRVEDIGDKYNGWVSSVYSGLIAPNFTTDGWALTKAPEEVMVPLRSHLHRGLAGGNGVLRTEGHVRAIGGSERGPEVGEPLMIEDANLNDWVLRMLKPLHEAWSGIALEPNNAYGLRVYKNHTNLNMHIDKSETHVISGILHVDHDPAPSSQPWPLVIEDLHGRTVEVTLESGDLLLYESSKCYHGRPTRFDGHWYTSLFLHYYPADVVVETSTNKATWKGGERLRADTHYRIPPSWAQLPPDNNDRSTESDLLVVVETSIKEPNCVNEWCDLQNSVKVSGPAKEGILLSASGEKALYPSLRDEL